MAGGWVLLIEEDAEQARVLLALLVCVVFLVLRVTVKPLHRCASRERIETATRRPVCCAFPAQIAFDVRSM